MPELPVVPFDPAAVERIREGVECRQKAQREDRWLTTGWGAVGVHGCGRCSEIFEGVAYVYGDPFYGRVYFCPSCVRRERDIKRAVERAGAKPRPCEVCGRKFAWVRGHGPRVGPGGSIDPLQLHPLPRPRLHVCSDACRRERRNRARRVQHDEQRRCAGCRRSFVPTRADQLYHSAACRQRAYRRRIRER